MDYLDFFQYGQTDIQRSKKFYNENDYQISAFFAQQALEKYLKGYLLKNEIIDNVKNLGHLQIPEIIAEMMSYSKKINPNSNDYLKSGLDALENLSDLFVLIESKRDVKVAVWKNSLSLPLDKNESNIVEGYVKKFIKRTDEFFKQSKIASSDYEKILEKLELNKIDTSTLTEKEKIGVEFLKKVPDMLAMKTDESALEFMNKVMNHYGWGSGGGTLPKELSNNMTKYLKLWKCLDWADIIVSTYPHQEISRYPFQINGKMVDKIYTEQKDDLKNLLEMVKTTCKEIREQN